MFKTLRIKLLVGLTPLLGIMVGLGLWAIVMFSRLGNNIDVILRENYQSVLAVENLKESLERLDSAALFALGGRDDRAREQFNEYLPSYHHALSLEQNNVTLPGEGEMVKALTQSSEEYLRLSDQFYALAPRSAQRENLYFNGLLPTFTQIKKHADDILNLNQTNMETENDRARRAALFSTRVMIGLLLCSAAVASIIAYVLSHSILEPIKLSTQAAKAIAQGQYDQVVPATTRDELGELAQSFNTMARKLREYQQAGTARLVRAQKTAQATIDSIPDPVVVVDPQGVVERSNPAARIALELPPIDSDMVWLPPAQVQPALISALKGEPDGQALGLNQAIPMRINGQERYFLPRVLAIRSEDGLLGAAVVFSDVTKFRLVDQLKSDMVATVSHELKTPLTSLQMAVHLLLEEAVGPVNSKQVELLVAARQDSDRLLNIINDLLDLTRIEQGVIRLDPVPTRPSELISQAVATFENVAKDAGLELHSSVEADLPSVMVDQERIQHVFTNLLTNAIAHTPKLGSITIAAERDDDGVRFTVSDTGEGIDPQYVERVFERFFRVPGSRSSGGVGLGLAIAREIVQAHHGSIRVTSIPHQGTQFHFRLPIASPTDGSLQPGSIS